MEPTEGVLSLATGIPPHIETSRQLATVLHCLDNLIDFKRTVKEDMKEAVIIGLDQRQMEAGTPSMNAIGALMAENNKEQNNRIDATLQHILAAHRKTILAQNCNNNNQDENENENDFGDNPFGEDNNRENRSNVSCYNGQFYFVPKNFVFPIVTIWEGLRLGRQSVGYGISVLPYRKLQGKLPTTKNP